MNVTELKEVVDRALERGLHPETTVVVASEGWYSILDEVEDPSEPGRYGTDRQLMWLTLNVGEDADSRFTPGHEVQPDPVLFAEFTADDEESKDPESVLYGTPVGDYPEWLQDRYDGLAGALRDDPPKDRSELADVYHGMAAYLRELERMS